MKQGDRIRRSPGAREEGDSPLLEQGEEEDGEKGRECGQDEWPACAPHADLLSSAICTLPRRRSARPAHVVRLHLALKYTNKLPSAAPSSLSHAAFHIFIGSV